MPKIVYKQKRLGPASLAVINRANQILEEYAAQGFDLTLRQLYYQFVARGLIDNTDREYKKLGGIVNDGRLTGRIDWNHITDRTRNLRGVTTWDSPTSIIRASSRGYREDLWRDQDHHVEVWIEKDALVGVIAGVCDEQGVDYFSCRGYTSQSEMWSAAQRLGEQIEAGKQVTVLHLGDHDPSGIDMSRDIETRLFEFMAYDECYRLLDARGLTTTEGTDITAEGFDRIEAAFKLDRLALNWDQIEKYEPPPNPAKVTDSRARGYIAEHGDQSWELDALEPTVIAALISDAISEYRDEERWEAALAAEAEHQHQLEAVYQRWNDVVKLVGE